MTALAIAAAAALLVLVTLIVFAGIRATALGRRHVANRPPRHAFLLSHDARIPDGSLMPQD